MPSMRHYVGPVYREDLYSQTWLLYRELTSGGDGNWKMTSTLKTSNRDKNRLTHVEVNIHKIIVKSSKSTVLFAYHTNKDDRLCPSCY